MANPLIPGERMPVYPLNMRFLFGVAFLSGMSLAQCCCITYDDIKMRLVGEDAIIVWDQKKGLEHFIRAAIFDGKAENFGFILPVPSRPTAIETVDERVFAQLEGASPIVTFGRGSKTGSVEVVDQKQVGDYQATVLKATDAAAMGHWLKKYGHQMRPAMKPWLQHYTDRAWMFVAFKYTGQMGPTPTQAVRVSFNTDRPHYPYKMPSDTFASGQARRMRLFVVSQTPVKAAHWSGKVWDTKPIWSSALDEKQAKTVAKQLGANGKPLILPKDVVVTRFENSPKAIYYDEDLAFAVGPKVDPFSKSASWNRGIIAGIGLAAVGLGLLRRRLR